MAHNDPRRSLLECGVSRLRLGTREYTLDPAQGVSRGGTCLVYHAMQSDDRGADRRVILKEFYPEISGCDRWRAETGGALELPEKDLVEALRQRFERSYELFKIFFNEKELNLYTVQAQGYPQGNGTSYMVVDYSSGMTLGAYMARNPSLWAFLTRMKVVAQILERLHDRGYVYMDLKPENLLCYEDHDVIKVLDTDSILEKEIFAKRAGELLLSDSWENILEEEAPSDLEDGVNKPVLFLSGSRGYIAPEVQELAEGLEEYWLDCYYQRRQFAKIGHRADFYAFGVILQRFFRKDCPEEMLLADCLRKKEPYLSGKAVRLLEELLEKTRAEDPEDRFENGGQLQQALERVLPLLNPEKPRLARRLSRNPFPVLGREKQLEQMEQLLDAQKGPGGRILCLSGIGGVGKSVLARCYAAAHEPEYDVVTEVTAASAWEAVERITIVNWEPEPGLSEERYREKRKTELIRLCQKEKLLLLVHDYDVSEDSSLDIWRELGCDVILTSRHDWAASGIPTLTLRCNDLAEAQAKGVFRQYYLPEEALRRQRLEERLDAEDEALTRLVNQADRHPLTLKLLARYMAGVPGQELGPRQALEEWKVFDTDSPREFQNDRDSAVARDNAFGHLARIFRQAMDGSRFRPQELGALRVMLLIPSGYGISPSRFEKWSELSGDWLARLHSSGWLEYLPEQQDVLQEDAPPGVYVMPRALQQVLGQEAKLAITPALAQECGKMFFELFGVNQSYGWRKGILANMEHMLTFPGEESAGQVWLLLWLSEIYGALGKVEKLKEMTRQVLELSDKLPPEALQDEKLRYSLDQARRTSFLVGGSVDQWKPREQLRDLGEAVNEIQVLFDYRNAGEAIKTAKGIRLKDWKGASRRDQLAYWGAMTTMASQTGFPKLADRYYQEMFELFQQEILQPGKSNVDPPFFGAAWYYACEKLRKECTQEDFQLLTQLHTVAADRMGAEGVFATTLEDLLADACILRGDPAAAAQHRERSLRGEMAPVEKACRTLHLALDYGDREPEKTRKYRQEAMELFNNVLLDYDETWRVEEPEELVRMFYYHGIIAVPKRLPLALRQLEEWLRLARRLYDPGTAAIHYAAAAEIMRHLGLKEKAALYRSIALEWAGPWEQSLGLFRPGSRQLLNWADINIGKYYRQLISLSRKHKVKRPIW